MAHDEHHFVPAFLLRQWQSGDDNKLTSFRWSRGRVVDSRFKAKSVAKQRHLYATGVGQGRADNALEREFMGPKVDDPAAVAHQVMLTQGIEALTEDHWRDWARFCVCQWLRTPEKVAQLRIRGRQLWMKDLEPVTGESLEEADQTMKFSDWLTENKPGLFDDFGLEILPHIVESELLNGVFLAATWGIRDTRWAKHDLVIGDTPLVYEGQMANNFLFALPLTPRVLFVAYSDDETGKNLDASSHDKLAITFNRSQVGQAQDYVFAINNEQRALVSRYLQRPDS